MPDVLADPSPPSPPARRRPLTELQAAVIDSMLSGEPGSERGRIRISGVAPRTYQLDRRRALDSKWVAERFIPDPALFDRPRISFVLARPKPSEFDTTVEGWSKIEGTVLMWKTPTSLFGVFSSDGVGQETPVVRELATPGRYARAFLLEVDVTSPTLPIYFDFEAEWSRVAGIPGTSYYPRPLPRHPRGTARARASITARWREIVRNITRTAAPSDGSPQGQGFVSHLGQRANIARALRSGWLDRRTFLNPAAVPPFGEWSLRQVVFIHGRLRDGKRPEGLLRTLFVSCAVHPFLFAASHGHLLMATLSPAPDRETRTRRAVSVAGTLTRYLERMEVDRMPAEELETVVDHRTDLFAQG